MPAGRPRTGTQRIVVCRVPPEVLEAVKIAAAKDRRSLSGFVTKMVCDWYDDRQAAKLNGKTHDADRARAVATR